MKYFDKISPDPPTLRPLDTGEEVQLHHYYKDRSGRVWQVVEINGARTLPVRVHKILTADGQLSAGGSYLRVSRIGLYMDTFSKAPADLLWAVEI